MDSQTLISSYNSVGGKSPVKFQKLSAIIPVPSSDDYEYGYICRFFIQKIGDIGFVVEIDQKTYDNYLTNPFYTTGFMKWMLNGPKDSIYDSNGVQRAYGVYDWNYKQLSILSASFKGTSLTSIDPLQFWRGY